MGTFIGTELDDTVEQVAQVTLTSLCVTRLTATVEMPIALFLIQNQVDPIWQQCPEDVFDLVGPHFHVGMAVMAEYA
jgi:hypothetical protein